MSDRADCCCGVSYPTGYETRTEELHREAVEVLRELASHAELDHLSGDGPARARRVLDELEEEIGE